MEIGKTFCGRTDGRTGTRVFQSTRSSVGDDLKIEAVPPFGGPGSPSNSVAWAKTYLHNKWYPDAFSCLATIDMVQKLGGCSPFWGELGLHLTMSPGPRPTFVVLNKWHIDPSRRLATTDMGQNLGAVPPFWGSWIPI